MVADKGEVRRVQRQTVCGLLMVYLFDFTLYTVRMQRSIVSSASACCSAGPGSIPVPVVRYPSSERQLWAYWNIYVNVVCLSWKINNKKELFRNLIRNQMLVGTCRKEGDNSWETGFLNSRESVLFLRERNRDLWLNVRVCSVGAACGQSTCRDQKRTGKIVAYNNVFLYHVYLIYVSLKQETLREQ